MLLYSSLGEGTTFVSDAVIQYSEVFCCCLFPSVSHSTGLHRLFSVGILILFLTVSNTVFGINGGERTLLMEFWEIFTLCHAMDAVWDRHYGPELFLMEMLESTTEKGSWEGWGQSILCNIMAYWSKHRNVCFSANLMLHIRGCGLLFHNSWDFLHNHTPSAVSEMNKTKQIEKKLKFKKCQYITTQFWLFFCFLILKLPNFQIYWFFFFAFTISLSLYFPST